MKTWLVGVCVALLVFGVGSMPGGFAQLTDVGQEVDLLWLWGEVVSVNNLKNELKVKYLDYETDTEKEIIMTIDEKTTFENVKSLSDIKPQDTVSIDYILTGDGKNLVKNLSVERPDLEGQALEGNLSESMDLPRE